VKFGHAQASKSFDYIAKKVEVFGFYKFKAENDRNFAKRCSVIDKKLEQVE